MEPTARVCEFSTTLPSPPESEISRDAVINLINHSFNQHKIIVLNALEGWGKTTALAQFVRAHCDQAISVFVGSSTQASASLGNIRFELANQAHWLRESTQLPVDQDISDEDFVSHLWRLNRFAFRTRRRPIIVVDGLGELPKDSAFVARQIFDLFPYEVSSLRFLFSGSDAAVFPPDSFSIPLQPFSRSDAITLLSGLPIDESEKEEVIRFSGGIPAKLITIRRLLRAGQKIDDVLDGQSEEIGRLIEKEWALVDTRDDDVSSILALLAFDSTPHTFETCAEVLALPVDDVRRTVNSVPFLSVSDGDGQITFPSESYRQFVASRLEGKKRYVLEMALAAITSNSAAETRLQREAGYLAALGKTHDVANIVTADAITSIAKKSLSHAAAIKQIDEVLRYSSGSGLTPSVFRATLFRNALSATISAASTRAEVRALLALGLTEQAEERCAHASKREDRLALLAAYARYHIENDLELDQGVVEELDQLSQNVDPEGFDKEDAIEVGRDLMFVDSEFAFRLVSSLSDPNDEEDSVDWALMALTLSVMTKSGGSESGATQAVAHIQDKFENQTLRAVSLSLATATEDVTADEILTRAAAIDGTNDKLLMFRMWCLANPRTQGAERVIEQALNVAISDREFVLSASHVNDLVTVLYASDTVTTESPIFELVSGQLSALRAAGPVPDYVGVVLAVSYIEFKESPKDVSNRLIDLLFETVASVGNGVTKAICLARILGWLISRDEKKVLEQICRAHTDVREELESQVAGILDSTIDNYAALREVIRELARSDAALAESFALRLNTWRRRQYALSDIAEILGQTLSDKNLDAFHRTVIRVEIPRYRDRAIIQGVASLERIKKTGVISPRIAEVLVELVSGVSAAIDQSLAFARIARLLAESQDSSIKYPVSPEELADRSINSLNLIDRTWAKAEVCFEIAEEFSKPFPDKARDVLQRAMYTKGECAVCSDSAASGLNLAYQLSARSLAALMTNEAATDTDIGSFVDQIKSMPSLRNQVFALSDLVCWIYGSNWSRYRTSAEDLVVNELIPVLRQLNGVSGAVRNSAYHRAFPSLWITNREYAEEFLGLLPAHQKANAIAEAADVIFKKAPISEPTKSAPDSGWSLQFQDFIAVIPLITLTDDLSVAYSILGTIVDSLLGPSSKNLSRPQRGEVENKLAQVVADKFSDNQFIGHCGYEIVSKVEMLRTTGERSFRRWSTLIEDAESVSNSADRIFVLATIAQHLPAKHRGESKKLIERCRSDISDISSIADQIDRLSMLAQVAQEIDIGMSKEIIKQLYAMTSAADTTEEEVRRARETAVEIATNIDMQFAESLVNINDDDPARQSEREQLRREKRKREVMKIFSGDKQWERLSDRSRDISDYAWRQLAFVNAGRAEAVKMKNIGSVIELARGMSIHAAYPILCLVIQSLRIRTRSLDRANIDIRPLFEASISTASMMRYVMEMSAGRRSSRGESKLPAVSEPREVFGHNERGRAFEVIRKVLENGELEYVKLADPYFRPDDLDLVKLIKSVNPDCSVSIVTSLAALVKYGDNIGVAFSRHWKRHISELEPPPTEVLVLAHGEAKGSPIHDRWLVCGGRGVRLGTSSGSIGGLKVSEISEIDEAQAREREGEIDKFLFERLKSFAGEPVRYMLFTL